MNLTNSYSPPPAPPQAGGSVLAPISLYIHWPFCKSKCPYCDFNSHVRERIDEDAFVNALLGELDYMVSLIGDRELISIFFGGGTPSLMSPDAVDRILAHVKSKFKRKGEIEITLEANPTSVEAEKFRGFYEAGINRVSLGVQSLKQDSLSFLGREHTAKEALRAVELAADIFPRYSFDLIYALPSQSVESWKAELKEAFHYVGDHMSLYQLTIEERTAFYHAYHQEKAFELPVEDLAANLYEVTQEVMEAHGLPAYEISNHAKPGFESQHNLSYWLGREYIGVGPGAHGRINIPSPTGGGLGRGHSSQSSALDAPLLASPLWGEEINRFATNTIKSPELWLETVKKQGYGLEACTPLAEHEQMEEKLMMRTRLNGLIPFNKLPPLPHDYLESLENQGVLTINSDGFILTRQGMLIQQYLVGELVSKISLPEGGASITSSA